MMGAPDSGERITEQLLDGQQRLTSLWCSLHNKYNDRVYLVEFEDDPHNEGMERPVVSSRRRYYKRNSDRLYPLWVDSPKHCWLRRKIPVDLLQPSDITPKIRQWISSAIDEDQEKKDALFDKISTLRNSISNFNLPLLSLPVTTPKEIALDVFVKLNTSSVKLKPYEIIVALVEGETGKSIRDHVERLKSEVPYVSSYNVLPNLVLDVVALRQNRVPGQAGYHGIDFTKLIEEWVVVTGGIKRMTTLLREESIFDALRLPSKPPTSVIAALWEQLPRQPDKLGNSRHLLQKYLWLSFLTERYEQASASKALQDYRGLRDTLLEKDDKKNAPIFNKDWYSSPVKEQILRAPWPRNKTILGRGLLALQIKCGALDLADGRPATADTIPSREYHHLFPKALLADAEVPRDRIQLSLNCALITWRTNRTISNKDPLAYLKERADNGTLGEAELRRRLRSHLIPYDELNVGYEGMSDDDRRVKVREDYDRFLQSRAKLLEKAAQLACNGEPLDIDKIFEATSTQQGNLTR